MESAKARFGGLGRNLKDKLERIDAKVSDSKALSEAKSRLSGGAATFRRCAAAGAPLSRARAPVRAKPQAPVWAGDLAKLVVLS